MEIFQLQYYGGQKVCDLLQNCSLGLIDSCNFNIVDLIGCTKSVYVSVSFKA